MLIEICLPSLPEIFARTNRFREIYPSDLSRAAGYKRISDIFSIVEVFDGNYRCRALVGKFSRFSSGPARPFNNNILRLIVIFFFHVRGFRAERRESVFFFFSIILRRFVRNMRRVTIEFPVRVFFPRTGKRPEGELRRTLTRFMKKKKNCSDGENSAQQSVRRRDKYCVVVRSGNNFVTEITRRV